MKKRFLNTKNILSCSAVAFTLGNCGDKDTTETNETTKPTGGKAPTTLAEAKALKFNGKTVEEYMNEEKKKEIEAKDKEIEIAQTALTEVAAKASNLIKLTGEAIVKNKQKVKSGGSTNAVDAQDLISQALISSTDYSALETEVFNNLFENA